MAAGRDDGWPVRTSTAYMNGLRRKVGDPRVHGAISSGGYHPVDVSRDAELFNQLAAVARGAIGAKAAALWLRPSRWYGGVPFSRLPKVPMAGSTAGILNRPSPPRSLTATSRLPSPCAVSPWTSAISSTDA